MHAVPNVAATWLLNAFVSLSVSALLRSFYFIIYLDKISFPNYFSMTKSWFLAISVRSRIVRDEIFPSNSTLHFMTREFRFHVFGMRNAMRICNVLHFQLNHFFLYTIYDRCWVRVESWKKSDDDDRLHSARRIFTNKVLADPNGCCFYHRKGRWRRVSMLL